MTAEDRGETALEAVSLRRERIERGIDDLLPAGEPPRLYEATRWLFDAGGKRLRPALVLMVAEALAGVEPLSTDYRTFPTLDAGRTGGYAVPAEDDLALPTSHPRRTDGTVDVMAAAVSLEVVHSFTLIHDDIMDDDDLRRGVPAVHREFDLGTAILAGDTLYSIAYRILLAADAAPARTVEALDLLATTCTQVCEGQALDVSFEDRTDVLPGEYLTMIEHKTAALYAASAAIPAILLGADRRTADSLYRYGLAVGRAFQIQDDVLDLTVPSETLGKRRGSDLVENKQTIITLHAREQGVDVEGLVGDDPESVTGAEIDEAVRALEEAGSIDYARGMADDLVAEGKAHLSVLPEGRVRETLADLAEYLVERGY